MKGKLFLYHLKGTQRNKPVPLKDTSYLRLRLTEIKNIPFSSSKILKIITQMIIIVNTVFLTLTYLLQKMSPLSPAPHKAVFVSRTKFPVSCGKASQGDSLAAFLASIQEIFSSYETAKHFKMRNNCARKGKNHR